MSEHKHTPGPWNLVPPNSESAFSRIEVAPKRHIKCELLSDIAQHGNPMTLVTDIGRVVIKAQEAIKKARGE